MLRGIRSWLGEKIGVAVGAKDLSPVRPAGAPSFELLEPRLLLSADLPGVQPVLAYDFPSVEQAVQVDLDRQDPDNHGDVSPVLTIDLASGEQTDQPVSTSTLSETPAVQVECGVLTETARSDSPTIMQDDSAGLIVSAQQDSVRASETLPIEIRGPPTLPGLRLVDPDISHWQGQIIYLDFDGEQNVIYNGPVTVGPFDVPAFSLAGTTTAGQERAVVAEIVSQLQQTFAGSGVTFTATQPAASQLYSTIYIGGDGSVFLQYGSFLGLAEKVDVGNPDCCDEGFVFSDRVVPGEPGTLAGRLAGTIAHEVGHLLGFVHSEQCNLGGVTLRDVADSQSSTTRGIDIDLSTMPAGPVTGSVGVGITVNRQEIWLGVEASDLYKDNDPASAFSIPVAGLGAEVLCNGATPAATTLVWAEPTTLDDREAKRSVFARFSSAGFGHFQAMMTVRVTWDQPSPSLPPGTYSARIKLTVGIDPPPPTVPPRIESHTPSGVLEEPVSAIRFNFSRYMDKTSFSPADDVVSFTGPEGPVAVTGYSWADARTLEVVVDARVPGPYEMVLGPNILDVVGNAMNQDWDRIPGEVPDDQYVATFTIEAPRVVDHDPRMGVEAPVGSIRFSFSRCMDRTSFSPADDVVSFTGPEGPVAVAGYCWVDARTLDMAVDARVAGPYEMVLGPNILDVTGNAMDQDQDLITGEVPDDRYVATFTIEAPKCSGHTPTLSIGAAVSSINFIFDRTMDQTSFLPVDDIASFAGPQGTIVATGHDWLDSHTLETRFDPQTAFGQYQMVLGPGILDLAGNPLDQDNDGICGEPIDDRYVAEFELARSGTLVADTIWSPAFGTIVLDGTVTVPSGVTLTIEKGVIVKAAQGAGIDVYGVLKVLGTPAEPVVLTSLQDDTAGGDTNGDGTASTASCADWQGIWFYNPDQVSTLDAFEIRYAYAAICTGYWYWPPEGRIRLSNGILRCNDMALVARVAYAELDADNCLIVDNAHAIAGRNTAEITLRNCTIADNASYSEGKFTIFSFENCIFAFNGGSIVEVMSPTDLLVRNCLFQGEDASAVIGYVGETTFRNNGNLMGDPLFVDRAAGNYELAAGSPGVDVGTGILAPATDLLGRARHDDLGMPNVGEGYPCYVDIGAFERQEDTMAADLAVTYVSNPSPEFLSAGEPFTIDWTVTNVGCVAATEPWTDTVYVSTDPYLSNDDTVLAQQVHTGGLDADASYTETVTATTPSSSGVHYVLVRTNADRAFVEPVDSNNVSTASGVLAVDLPTLDMPAPGQPTSVAGTVANQHWTYVRLDAGAGNTVVLDLDVVAVSGATGLYVRYGLPPTLDQYDAVAALSNDPDRQVRILSPLDGSYYIGVYGSCLPGGSDFTLTASLTNLDVRTVSPNTVGNRGRATIKIEGDNFDPAAQATLAAPDGTVIEGQEEYQDSTTVFATFDLAAAHAAPGVYDLTIANFENETATVMDVMTVGVPTEPQFKASIVMPAVARPNRVTTVRVEYCNAGTSDLASPLLTLSGPDDIQWQLPGSEEWIIGPKLRLMALSSSGPANILRAGQSESIEVKVHTPFNPGTLDIAVYSLGAHPGDGSEQMIDWGNFYQPAFDDTDEAIRQELISEASALFGNTWGDYVCALGRVAADTAPLGVAIYSATELESVAFLRDVRQVETAVPAESRQLVAETASEQKAWYEDNGEEYKRPFDPYAKAKVCIWNTSVPERSIHFVNDAAKGDELREGVIPVEKWEIYDPKEHGTFEDKEVYLLIHGWRSGWHWDGDPLKPWETVHSWVTDMAYALEKTDHKYILLINWEKEAGSCTLNPFASAARIPGVVERVYPILRDDAKVDPGKLHMIGHSHGAHVAGLLGNKFGPDKVDQITALDPSEELSHWTLKNLFGSRWGAQKRSAKFIDMYRSSTILSGEVSWGHDCFRLINPEKWSDHAYAWKWYEQTIYDGTKDGTLPGYGWRKGSWDKLNTAGWTWKRGSDQPWNGIIDGRTGKVSCVNVGLGVSGWVYPGCWETCDETWARPGHFLFDIARAVEYYLVSASASAGGWWQAASSGTVSVTIRNNADNSIIPPERRYRYQEDAPHRDIQFWLSKDKQLDKSADYRLNGTWGTKLEFLQAAGEAGNVRTDDFSVALPSLKVIRGEFGEDSVPGDFYIIILVAEGYDWELYPENNNGSVLIHINREDLVAEAGERQDLMADENTGMAVAQLSPVGSGPLEVIDEYIWTCEGSVIGTTQKPITVYRSFSPGEHIVELTVRDAETGKTAADTVHVFVTEPSPNGYPEGGASTSIETSTSPEDKWGPAGYDAPNTPVAEAKHFVAGDETFTYRIEMWNKPDAPVPTQDAEIRDVVDPNLFDLSTFNFTRVGFLKWDEPITGGQMINTRIDCRPDMNIVVDITGTLDPQTGQIDWLFHTVDPMTGDYPEDPNVGFLPPFNPETGFEIGWMEFTVKPKAGLATGTEIANQAFVQFDYLGPWGPAPKAGPWINTIDAGTPTSAVEPLPPTTATTDFVVNWSGQDDSGGSGIASYDIFVSDNGGNYALWKDNTIDISATFTGQNGHTYAFYGVARDNVGHEEAPPVVPDAQTTVMTNQPPVVDAGEDGSLDEGTVFTRTGSFTDSDTVDSWTATVDYGDGGGPQELILGPDKTFVLNHVYADDRSQPYAVTVVVTDSFGESDTDQVLLTVQNVAPRVAAGSDEAVNEGSAFTFAGAFTDPGLLDTHMIQWDFGDGSTASGTLKPSHIYADGDNTYTVTLTVTDDDGGIGTDTLTVTVNNVTPTIELTGAPNVFEGSRYTLHLGQVTDPGADTVTKYIVDWGDDTADTYTSAGDVTHVYADGPQAYAIGVGLVDEDGTHLGAGTQGVLVENVAPTVSIDSIVQPNPRYILASVHTVTLAGSFSDPGRLDTHTAVWDFGDGSHSEPGALTTASHVYAVAGSYTVTLTVTDDDGGVGIARGAVTVVDAVWVVDRTDSYIQALSSAAFKGPASERKNALHNKLVEVKLMIERGGYQGASNKLLNDVRAKADGFMGGKANDDWIIDLSAQLDLCNMVDDIRTYLSRLLAGALPKSKR